MSADSAKVFTRQWWNVERDGGRTVICGFDTAELAHAQAKPRGFRKPGVVIRYDLTRSYVVDGNITVDVSTTVRTEEA